MLGNKGKRQETLRLRSGQAGDKRQKSQEGFTLLEILVVVSLFVILSVVIVNVYLMSLRAQRQTSYRQRTVSSIRQVMEDIARQVRVSEIDYSYYDARGNGVQEPDNDLALIDQAGIPRFYTLNVNGEIEININSQAISMTNVSEMEILNIDFYINPITSPFIEERCNGLSAPTGCQPTALGCTVNDIDSIKIGFCQCSDNSDCLTGYCEPTDGVCLSPNSQPRVTIVLAFKSKGLAPSSRPEEEKVINLQTTVSSRVYKR